MKKRKVLSIHFLLLVILCALFFSCKNKTNVDVINEIDVITSITLTETSHTFTGDEDSFPLDQILVIEPSGAASSDIIWTSNNPNIAGVNSDGVVFGITAGTATITGTSPDGKHSVTFEITVTKNISMVGLSAGTFNMGNPDSAAYDEDYPQHSVSIAAFSMGKYQVMQALFEVVMGYNPSEFNLSKPSYMAPGEVPQMRPVESVSWYEAIVFCNRLSIKEGKTPVYSIGGKTSPDDWGTVPVENNATWNGVAMTMSANGYRLPTEAEWEFACRAGTISSYSCGSAPNDAYMWYVQNSNSRIHQVGLKTANSWGLFDMHGNVMEWCWDWHNHEYYRASSSPNPTGPSGGTHRVSRGGWFGNGDPQLRSYKRASNNPSAVNHDTGLRVVARP